MRRAKLVLLAALAFAVVSDAARAQDAPFRREADGSLTIQLPEGELAIPALSAARANGEVFAPGPVPEAGDLVIGKPDAPVIVYEYASYFCTDCRKYRHEQHPRVLRRLVESGAIRFVHRDFPLNQLAFKAAVLTRCALPGQHDRMVTELLIFQHTWGGMKDPTRGLSSIALAYGIPRDRVEGCLGDATAIKRVADEFTTAQTTFGVAKLPTFFFVGDKAVARAEGVLTLEHFKTVIAALEKAAAK